MSHGNAALTPVQRLRIGRLVVEEGWPVARAAEYFRVSWPTALRWADRYRAQAAASEDGVVRQAAMADRSSRPLRMPTRTPQHNAALVVGYGTPPAHDYTGSIARLCAVFTNSSP